MKVIHICLISIFMTGVSTPATEAELSPVKELKNLSTNKAVFAEATRKDPIVLKSSREGKKYFKKEALPQMAKVVNFQKQKVLIFAWHGSGGDRFTYEESKDRPSQIEFTYHPGRTRDLRPHVKIFALGTDVKWSVK